MTQGGWSGNPFDDNTAHQNPLGASGPSGPNPPVITGPPPSPPGENNVLATLSVVFAFVFAPVGAVLGHLALAHPRRQHRDRALVGLALSYTFIVVAVIATVVWATQSSRTDAAPSAAAASAPAAAPSAAPPPTTTAPPPLPIVAPAGLPNLLPSLEEVRTILGAPDLVTTEQNATDHPTDAEDSPAQRAMGECAGAVNGPRKHLYVDNGAEGSLNRNDRSRPTFASMEVTAFPDAAKAQQFTTQTVEVWRRCVGQQVFQPQPNGQKTTYDVGKPVDTDGIIALPNTVTMPNGAVGSELLVSAAKSNVAVSLVIVTQSTTAGQATKLAKIILDHIHA